MVECSRCRRSNIRTLAEMRLSISVVTLLQVKLWKTALKYIKSVIFGPAISTNGCEHVPAATGLAERNVVDFLVVRDQLRLHVARHHVHPKGRRGRARYKTRGIISTTCRVLVQSQDPTQCKLCQYCLFPVGWGQPGDNDFQLSSNNRQWLESDQDHLVPIEGGEWGTKVRILVVVQQTLEKYRSK